MAQVSLFIALHGKSFYFMEDCNDLFLLTTFMTKHTSEIKFNKIKIN